MQIQNLELIESKITNFTWTDLKCISAFKYYLGKNKYFEDISILEL